MNDETLAVAAVKARAKAYAPYSRFYVGAALLAENGRIYTGCNIENAAYGPSNCAERTAFFKAVSEGERQFMAIAVAGWADGHSEGFAFPCGVCRQVMMEFCDPECFRVIVVEASGKFTSYVLKALLPYGFGPASLTHG